MKIDFSEPGFYVSGAAHALLLVAALVAFSRNVPFEDAQEASPVDLITDSQFNQIMKGEKTAPHVLPTPTVRSQSKSDTPEPKPRPAIADAKEDTPSPPPPQMRVKEPGEDDQPETAAALPPDRPPDLTQPVPMPPPRPQDKTPPPPPQTAEAVDPPLPPRLQRPTVTKDPPLPPTQRPVARTQEQLNPDQIAKLIAHPSHPRSHDDPSENRDSLDTTQIAQLLSRDTPQQRAAASREVATASSLGSETASAAKMSPSMWGALDGLLQDQYKRCWSYLGLDEEHRYIPQVKVLYSADGSLADEPELLNPPSDPSLQSLAESAVRAVRECNPLKIPSQFAPYFNQWKARILRFDPEEMSG